MSWNFLRPSRHCPLTLRDMRTLRVGDRGHALNTHDTHRLPSSHKNSQVGVIVPSISLAGTVVIMFDTLPCPRIMWVTLTSHFLMKLSAMEHYVLGTFLIRCFVITLSVLISSCDYVGDMIHTLHVLTTLEFSCVRLEQMQHTAMCRSRARPCHNPPSWPEFPMVLPPTPVRSTHAITLMTGHPMPIPLPSSPTHVIALLA
ncbi:hypothetical protein RRG08_046666 [Elysia crispata]|uniref:Uncharacterized protein n=1 Tax=Elysia crispata TaxID=231223 RepID=A0AAE1BCH7_9GAST|nr:hypothetical protein RRG08_046666 [Elysia crispata]